MKKLFPIAIAMLGAFALFGILFLLIRSDAIPARVRGFEWRKATATPPAMPVEDETA